MTSIPLNPVQKGASKVLGGIKAKKVQGIENSRRNIQTLLLEDDENQGGKMIAKIPKKPAKIVDWAAEEYPERAGLNETYNDCLQRTRDECTNSGEYAANIEVILTDL